MRLRGIFWKEGINGLGVFGFHRLPYRKRFDWAARTHDSDYDYGYVKEAGGHYSRFYDDKKFLGNCLDVCRNDTQCFFAIIYFVFVRFFGWAFFRYGELPMS